ncbi:hypothetical protein QB910_000138 [Dabrowskivirus KKP3916]|uniref:Uncharacterized protein n=1 Tax=Alicyclobacillus phage KKP_3916 TaxID=3040651 RepID=A0AAT9V843_9CAUD|nr:hypothetical protein QB910_000138 [Alicyclobacillus phage KKP 3916]
MIFMIIQFSELMWKLFCEFWIVPAGGLLFMMMMSRRENVRKRRAIKLQAQQTINQVRANRVS